MVVGTSNKIYSAEHVPYSKNSILSSPNVCYASNFIACESNWINKSVVVKKWDNLKTKNNFPTGSHKLMLKLLLRIRKWMWMNLQLNIVMRLASTEQ